MINPTKIIRDPIYGYIHLTDFELAIVNTKIFSRLRNISQSATAYLTYPSDKVCRYTHSMGTMELASRMIEAALRNASPKIVTKFLNKFSDEFSVGRKNAEDMVIKSVRLMGLLHDIGHLPFSHLGEGALKSFESELYVGDLIDWEDYADHKKAAPKAHEFATYQIIRHDKELKNVFQRYQEDQIKDILLKVLYPNRSDIGHSLYELISSDVDADRGDYLRRDGQTSGIGFGSYDIDRLVESMTIWFDFGKKRFYIRPSLKALSSVESFLVERFKLYKWLYYHQHVVLTDRILMMLMRCLIKANTDINTKHHPLKGLLTLEMFHYSNYLKDGTPFDDNAVISILRKSKVIVEKFLQSKRISAKLKYELLLYDRMLRILLDREVWSVPVWKNLKEYLSVENEALHKIKDRDPNTLPKRVLDRYAKELANPIDSNANHSAYQSTITYSLSTDKYFIIETEKSFDPYEPLEDTEDKNISNYFLISETSNSQLYLTSMSSLTRALRDAWDKEMHLFVYAIFLEENTKKQQVDAANAIKEKLISHIANLYQEGIL